MRLPTWEELRRVDEQLNVLEYPLDQSLFVVGPPGSGKTVLAVRRAQMIAETYAGVVVVTYNRMLRRLMALLVDGGVDARTMHSFVWSDYFDRIGKGPPTQLHDSFAYIWATMLARMKSRGMRPNRPHLVVDEAQDLPPEFFVYVSHYVATSTTIFADEDQALKAECTTLEQIKHTAGMKDPEMLSQNHRNTPEVSRLAEHFHSGRLPAATVHRSLSGEIPRLIQSKNIEATATTVSNWYRNRGGSIGVIISRNKTGRKLRESLADQLSDQRVDMYGYQQRNEEAINVLEDGITVVNKDSAKGLEFDTVFIAELDCFIPCTNDMERRAMYMMCTRARDHLFLVYGPGPLTAMAAAALPGADVLERS